MTRQPVSKSITGPDHVIVLQPSEGAGWLLIRQAPQKGVDDRMRLSNDEAKALRDILTGVFRGVPKLIRRNCEHCGKPFEAAGVTNRVKTCSPECRHERRVVMERDRAKQKYQQFKGPGARLRWLSRHRGHSSD
jgi:hypothetical protein